MRELSKLQHDSVIALVQIRAHLLVCFTRRLVWVVTYFYITALKLQREFSSKFFSLNFVSDFNDI